MAVKLRYDVETADPVVSFERDGFARYLALKGKRSFQLSPACETCAFLFERLESQRISPKGLAERLASGRDLLDPDLLEAASALLPSGVYGVVATTVEPKLTAPCGVDDYFAHESIELFGLPAYSGVPDNPRIP